MMGDNYSKLVERISEAGKLSVEDVERRVEAKRAKLSGLVSKEGAAQIVASELGINFDNERMKISELVQGMRKVNVIGKILEIYPIRKFVRNGREGRVCSFLLADQSSNVRVVLWDEHQIDLVEKGKIKKENVIEIYNAGFRNGEIHLGNFSDLKISKEAIGEVVSQKVYAEKNLSEVKQGERFKTRAVIVNVFEPRFFEVCPECGKKVVSGKCSGGHGEVAGKKRAVLSVVLDDGTESMRCALFGEQIEKLGLREEEVFDLNVFSSIKERLLGEEKFFVGNLKKNEMFNNFEMGVEDILDFDVNELIKEMEARA